MIDFSMWLLLNGFAAGALGPRRKHSSNLGKRLPALDQASFHERFGWPFQSSRSIRP